MKRKMLDIELKPVTEAEHDKLIWWLRTLLDGVENSNSQAERVAKLAHSVISPTAYDDFEFQVMTAISVGDWDGPPHRPSRNAFDALFPEIK